MNVSFFGRLTRDPEQKTSQDGRTVYTSFSVATTVRAKGEDNKNKSIFVNVTAFGNTGNIISQYFHKGSRIVVNGEINDISIWTGQQDGQAHVSTNVNMTGFDFVDTQAESGNQPQGYGNAPAQGYGNAPQGYGNNSYGNAAPNGNNSYGNNPPYGNTAPNSNQPPANNGYTAPNNNRPPAAPNYGASNGGYAAPNNTAPNNGAPVNKPW